MSGCRQFKAKWGYYVIYFKEKGNLVSLDLL